MGRKLPQKIRETAVKKASQDLVPPDFNVGTMIIAGNGDVFKVLKIDKKGEITYGYQDDDGEWTPYGTAKSYEELMEKYTVLDRPIEEYEKMMLEEMSNGFQSFVPNEEETSTDVVLSSGPDKALEAKRHVTAITQKLHVIEALATRKVNELAELRRNFETQLKGINRVIGIIELYLGANSEIVQIREGLPADEDQPICFRQMVLHMDEEVALDFEARDDQGLDFQDVDVFDSWVKKNTDKILPEKKGVVVARPRRFAREYGQEDPFADEKNGRNFITYILIRNGKNLYRIRTEQLNIYPRLFPSAAENEYLHGERESMPAGLSSSSYMNESEKEERLLGYKRNALFLQGLIDRTDVFKPHTEGLSIFKPETHKGQLKFIYDSEAISDGRKSYFDWLKEMNAELKRGDRIYFSGFPYGFFEDGGEEDRFPTKTNASRPKKGVYNIKRVEQYGSYGGFEDTFICHYNPKDTVYSKGYWRSDEPDTKFQRKQAIPFRLMKEDDFILNYEKVKIEDIEYYLQDRVNRKHYVDMMPVLKGIRKQLLEEKKMEDGFVELVMYQTKAPEDKVREAIEWWKRKVIEKRPLTREDAKAVRMITRYLKSGDTGEEIE